jgi:acyl-CoA thioesterase
MQFSELIGSMQERAGTWSVTAGDEWLQGRSLFGGLQSAIALRAMRALVPADVPLRTLQTTFIAPVPAGVVNARARVLRTGKSAIQVAAEIFEGDAVLCLLSGVFGAARESDVSIAPPQPPVPPGKIFDFRFIPGVTPNFTQYLPMRWLSGTPPYTSNPMTRHVIEVSLRDPGPMDEPHLLAIADAPPPVALSMLNKRAFGSSMTWTMEFLDPDLRNRALEGWRLDCEVVAAGEGYTSQSVMIWSPDGKLSAISRQSMVIFG